MMREILGLIGIVIFSLWTAIAIVGINVLEEEDEEDDEEGCK